MSGATVVEQAVEQAAREPVAWFADRVAHDLVDLVRCGSSDGAPAVLDHVERSGGWWALVADYEGAVVAARFADASRTEPAAGGPWPGLDASGWSSSLSEAQYVEACREVRSRIARGEVYQVNVCRVLEQDLPEDADVVALARLLRGRHPAPYAGAVVLPGVVEVVCASPELFLSRRGDLVTTGPIKGTAVTSERLLPKDVDENVMIVDLARNDLSIACSPGTVEVSDLLAVEQHPGLVHLVSRVRGRLRPDVGWGGLWSAMTPPASVTGAPKSSALRAITDLEPVARGPYCGAVGWIDVDAGTAELAVGIRTFWTARRDGRRVLRFGAGAGITWGSDPHAEWAETELKASRLLAVAAG
ncbi:chorismate-binding protein [Angustibacter luteus]|uniref:Chorismate-binding protein n=1 Tax=Angustibacter luteus TaxID=658456 RepID=A0ABW1J919_9ACTN